MRGKAAEHDRMDRAQTRAGQHRHQRLGDHGHVDDDAVALGDALGRQPTGKTCDLLLQLGKADLGFAASDRAVIDDRRAVAVACNDVAVHGVVAGVHPRIGKPFVQVVAPVKQRLRRCNVPINSLRRLKPIPFRVILPARIGFAISHDVSSLSWDKS